MRKLIGLAVAVAAIAGCAAPHQIVDRSDFLAEATRSYKGETRERLITAAERVLRQSDPADFEFRHSMNGFTGLRRFFIYAVIAASNGREKWEFQVDPEGKDMLRASISVSEAGKTVGGGDVEDFEGKLASVPLYRLFWNRVDYVLGKRPDWITCDQASDEARATNTNVATALGGLCGPTSDGRYSQPPPVLGTEPQSTSAQ